MYPKSHRRIEPVLNKHGISIILSASSQEAALLDIICQYSAFWNQG